MAVLSDTVRALVARIIQRRFASAWGGCTKPQLRAALDAADQWMDDNAASYNSALPTAFRTTASAADKAALVAFVAAQRAGILPTTAED